MTTDQVRALQHLLDLVDVLLDQSDAEEQPADHIEHRVLDAVRELRATGILDESVRQRST